MCETEHSDKYSQTHQLRQCYCTIIQSILWRTQACTGYGKLELNQELI